MEETPFKIKYCSVDGDPGYNNRFTEHFDLIFESLLNSDDEKAFKIIENFGFSNWRLSSLFEKWTIKNP